MLMASVLRTDAISIALQLLIVNLGIVRLWQFSEYVTAKEFSENVTLSEWSM
jgi:hypothetical protein